MSTVLLAGLLAAVLTGCAARGPKPLAATSMGAPVRVTGDFTGSVALEGEILSLQLTQAQVRFEGLRPGDDTSLEEVTLRAVIATDSAGQGIPMGVSGALQVADRLRVGETRDMGSATMAVPLPPGLRPRDLWLALQVRGTARPSGGEPELVIAYICSELNLFGVTTSAKARARRMRASYAAGCRL